MKYGLELPCGGDGVPAGLLVRLGVEAERAGWDGVFLEDHLVYYRGDNPATFDPWSVMAVMRPAPPTSPSAPPSPGCWRATR
jgi:alkanesulfonate monooxygenase SsuD/methylene tetrahydromethanopterin reductase-like flavin-dependent oxidoreductase (luciferase family)